MISAETSDVLYEHCKAGTNMLYVEMALDLIIKDKLIEKFPTTLQYISKDGGINSDVTSNDAGYLVTFGYIENDKELTQRWHFAFDLDSPEKILNPEITSEGFLEVT